MLVLLVTLAVAGPLLATAWIARRLLVREIAAMRAHVTAETDALRLDLLARLGPLEARHVDLHGMVQQVAEKQQFGARGPVK